MSVIMKIIAAETKAEKNATDRLVKNAADIRAEAIAIADIRAAYRGKEFAAAMKAQGFGNLGERDQRNNLQAVLWIATDEGAASFAAWLDDENRPNCATLRGIKKAATPKVTRAAQQPEGGEGGEGDEDEASADKAPRTCADILKNAFDQCRAAGISPDQFLDFVMSDQSMPVYDAAVIKTAA